MAVYPVLPSIGYSEETTYAEILRIYPSLTYRRYRRSNSPHRRLSVVHESISQTKMQTLKNFYNARKQSATDYTFTFYNPEETSVVDLSGASATGRYNAVFTDEPFVSTRTGRCTWSVSCSIMIVN